MQMSLEDKKKGRGFQIAAWGEKVNTNVSIWELLPRSKLKTF